MASNTVTSGTSGSTPGKARFRFDGGAPWLNFAATVGRAYSDTPIERLAHATDLDAWLTEAGMPAPTADLEDLTMARELRKAFRTVSEAFVRGQFPATSAVDFIAHTATRNRFTVDETGIAAWLSPADALGAIAMTALVTLGSPDRHLLAQCQDPECAWVFLDPGGRRHWCPAGSCGSRVRVRAHRARTGQTD